MAIENGTQIRVVLPEHLHRRLEHDAERAAVPVASMVRMILAGHYELLTRPAAKTDQQAAAASKPETELPQAA